MNARGLLMPRPSRRHTLFFGGVFLQVGFLLALVNVDSEDSFSMVITAAQAAPFVLLALLLWPVAAAMAVPLFAVVPGTFLGFSPAEWLLLGALTTATLRGLASGTLARRPYGVEWIYAAYVLWAALTVSQAIEIRLALEGLKRIIVLFLGFQAGVRLLGPNRAGGLLRVVGFVAPVVAIQLFTVILLSGLPLSYLTTRAGTLTNLGWGFSNYVAAVATLSAGAAVPLAFYGRTWERLLGIAGIIAAGFVSIATVSRGGTLALAVVLLVATAIEARRRFLLAACILAAVASAYIFSPLGQAGLQRFVTPKELPSVGVRVLFYREAFRITKEHALLGVGPDQIPQHSALYVDRNPHNFLLKNSADLGIPGLALYLIVFGSAALGARRYFRSAIDREDRIQSLTFVLMLVAAFTNALYEPTLEGSAYGLIFWITIGALFASGRARRSPSEPG